MCRREAIEEMERTIPETASLIDRLDQALTRAEAALLARDAERQRLRTVREAAEATRNELAAMLSAVEG